jgi:hypothetical protein
MSRPRSACRRVAPWLATVTAAVAGLAACGDDDDTATTSTVAATTTVPLTTQPVAVPSTTPVSSSAPASTVAPTSPPTTQATEVTSTTLPPSVALSGETLEVASALLANPFMLERVGAFGGLVVYDGESVDGDFSLRCIAVGHDGDTTWTEWCALPGDSSSFVVVDGIDPWVVDVGADHLDVTMTQMPSTWAVTSSGCVDPIVMLIGAAEVVRPLAVTGAACVADDALVTYSGVYMQPGSGDGGQVLLARGNEGWNMAASGTSITCPSVPTVCERFDVDSELLEAISPIPSPEHLSAQSNYVAVREVTSDVRGMAADAADLDAITDAIVAEVTSADSESDPVVARHDGVAFNQYSLLVITVPLPDDSFAATTYAVWITTETPEAPSAVHRAYAWDNCARGVADSQTCV